MITRKLVGTLLAMISTASPLFAAPIHQEGTEVRAGAFIGATVHMGFGKKDAGRPRAALTIAPTQSRITDGLIRTRIGEGIALNLSPRAKPTLTLAGVRADTALGLQPRGTASADQKQGLSTGATIAIGVGVVVAAAVALLVINANTNCGIGRDPDSCS